MADFVQPAYGGLHSTILNLQSFVPGEGFEPTTYGL